MDCNKDEAIRAKVIAEQKLKLNDLAGARKFALMAHKLFPGLDGISQMIANLDVHFAPEKTVSGEKDWYAILDVNASANEDAVKKQYEKLALLIHPDENKSVGARDAFKLISHAWTMLSVKSMRDAYDKRRNIEGSKLKTPQPSKNKTASSMPPVYVDKETEELHAAVYKELNKKENRRVTDNDSGNYTDGHQDLKRSKRKKDNKLDG